MVSLGQGYVNRKEAARCQGCTLPGARQWGGCRGRRRRWLGRRGARPISGDPGVGRRGRTSRTSLRCLLRTGCASPTGHPPRPNRPSMCGHLCTPAEPASTGSFYSMNWRAILRRTARPARGPGLGWPPRTPHYARGALDQSGRSRPRPLGTQDFRQGSASPPQELEVRRLSPS